MKFCAEYNVYTCLFYFRGRQSASKLPLNFRERICRPTLSTLPRHRGRGRTTRPGDRSSRSSRSSRRPFDVGLSIVPSSLPSRGMPVIIRHNGGQYIITSEPSEPPRHCRARKKYRYSRRRNALLLLLHGLHVIIIIIRDRRTRTYIFITFSSYLSAFFFFKHEPVAVRPSTPL